MAKVDELNHFPVCAIGDSMVAGLGDTTGRGWTGRLVESAGRRGLLLHVTNLGVRGDTSRMIVDRWDDDLLRGPERSSCASSAPMT